MVEVKTTWHIAGELLIIEARANVGGINYGLYAKVPPDGDPMEACASLRQCMQNAIDMNPSYMKHLGSQTLRYYRD